MLDNLVNTFLILIYSSFKDEIGFEIIFKTN